MAAAALWRCALAVPVLCWLVAALLQRFGPKLRLKDLPSLVALALQLDVFASDEVSGLCRILAWRQDRHTSFVVPNPDFLRVYVQECVLAFQTLPAEAQAQVLRLFMRREEFRESLTFEARHFRKRAVAPLAKPQGLPRKSREDLGSDGGSYEEVGVWPVQERTIEVGDIYAAFERGEVARVNVEKLEPGLVNITLKEIKEMDSEVADGISMDRFFVSLPCQLHLHQWASLHLRVRPWDALYLAWIYFSRYRELCEESEPRRETMLNAAVRLQEGLPETLGLLPLDPVQNWRPPLMISIEGVFFHGARVGMPGLTLNVRRLPHFSERLLPALERALSLGGVVERMEVALNTGATCGSFHKDLEDNVFVQLKGESHVFVYHCNATDSLTHQDDLTSLAAWLFDPNFPDRRDTPFYHLRLEAGEAVTIPSQCLHAVVSRDPRRIALSVWLQPSFGHMAWSSAAWNHFSTMQVDHMAARTLWMRTLGRVWDRHGIRMVHSFDNFEFL